MSQVRGGPHGDYSLPGRPIRSAAPSMFGDGGATDAGGEGKGADIAAWRQAARAEAASARKLYYAQLLVDLVKAFEMHLTHGITFKLCCLIHRRIVKDDVGRLAAQFEGVSPACPGQVLLDHFPDLG